MGISRPRSIESRYRETNRRCSWINSCSLFYVPNDSRLFLSLSQRQRGGTFLPVISDKSDVSKAVSTRSGDISWPNVARNVARYFQGSPRMTHRTYNVAVVCEKRKIRTVGDLVRNITIDLDRKWYPKGNLKFRLKRSSTVWLLINQIVSINLKSWWHDSNISTRD